MHRHAGAVKRGAERGEVGRLDDGEEASDRATAASLGELFEFDHDGRLAAAGMTAPFDERRATRTMAALTAMIDRSPAHCSASPMPSPQYGLEGPTSTGMT